MSECRQRKAEKAAMGCGQEEQPGSGWDGAASAAEVTFPIVGTTVFTAVIIRGTPNLVTCSLPHCFWLLPTSVEAAAAPQPFLGSSLTRRCAELCWCLWSSRSYSAMQRKCALKKNLDKNLSLWHFSHLFAQTKRYIFSMKPTVANVYLFPDFELDLYCIILVHLF